MGRQVPQGPVESADRRAGRADDHDVVLHVSLLFEFEPGCVLRQRIPDQFGGPATPDSVSGLNRPAVWATHDGPSLACQLDRGLSCPGPAGRAVGAIGSARQNCGLRVEKGYAGVRATTEPMALIKKPIWELVVLNAETGGDVTLSVAHTDHHR